MRIVLAGVAIELGPNAVLSDDERRTLETIEATSQPFRGEGPSFQLDLVVSPLWPADLDAFDDYAPAIIVPSEGGLRVTHRRFVAELDPAGLRGRVFRRDETGGALEIAVRIALQARLPLAGSLPLHSAGVAIDGCGLAFFGESGAGKTTLSRACPWPVLSDEMVALTGPDWQLTATGFWGAGGAGDAVASIPLRGLVELAKGPLLEFERLEPRAALRRLLRSVLVPPQTLVWGPALSLLGELVREVPVYRMAWNPLHLPWPDLEAIATGLPLPTHTRVCARPLAARGPAIGAVPCGR